MAQIEPPFDAIEAGSPELVAVVRALLSPWSRLGDGCARVERGRSY